MRTAHVAVLDDGVDPRGVGVEALVGLVARFGGGAGVDHGIARAEAVAVRVEAVVGGEGEVAVVGRPEELGAVQAVAVGFLNVDAVLGGAAGQQIAGDEAVGAIDAQDDVLGVGERARLRAGALVVLAAVEDHVLGLDA